MKRSKLFFSVLLITCPLFAGKKNGQDRCTELTTFYDTDIDDVKKLTIYDLENQYTSHALRKIVLDTFDSGKLPDNAMQTFENLVSFSPNFISLPIFLEKQIKKASSPSNKIDQKTVNTLILTSVNIACLKNLQEHHQKELANVEKKLTLSFDQLNKLENKN